MKGAETLCCPVTAPKPERSGEDLYGGVGQNPCCSVCRPGQELQETSDLCHCKQRFLYQILSSIFLLYQILISCKKTHTSATFGIIPTHLETRDVRCLVSPFRAFCSSHLDNSLSLVELVDL